MESAETAFPIGYKYINKCIYIYIYTGYYNWRIFYNSNRIQTSKEYEPKKYKKREQLHWAESRLPESSELLDFMDGVALPDIYLFRYSLNCGLWNVVKSRNQRFLAIFLRRSSWLLPCGIAKIKNISIFCTDLIRLHSLSENEPLLTMETHRNTTVVIWQRLPE